jgi:hypothetical protein
MFPTITARLKTLIAILAIAVLAGFGAPAAQTVAQDAAATEASDEVDQAQDTAQDAAADVEEEADGFDDWGLLGLLGLLGLGGLLKKDRHTVTTHDVEPRTRVVDRDVDVDTTRRV